MLEVPRKVTVAVEVVLDVAYHGSGRVVLASDAARRQGVSRRGLEPLLQQLTRADILISHRGPNGGYRLGRSRAQISVADIARAVLLPADSQPAGNRMGEGQTGRALAGSMLANPANPVAPRLSSHVLEPVWQALCDNCQQELEKLTIELLCRRARAAQVPGDPSAALDDFVI